MTNNHRLLSAASFLAVLLFPVSLLADITDGRALVYDRLSDSYLCSVPEELFDDGSVSAFIDDERAVRFTFLPILRLNGQFGNEYERGTVDLFMPDGTSDEEMASKVKWRGGTTNTPDKHKRNYHLKFINAAGKKQDRKFFGLRNDNSWLLDAAQVDFSRIRNRAATDLWNDFATRPYYADREPKALTGTRGQFVEVFLNDEYVGIYCMTEAMDRSQLKLKKYDDVYPEPIIHGQLWKSGGYENSFTWNVSGDVDNNSDEWGDVEMKYPDIDDVCPTSWQTYAEAVDFVNQLLFPGMPQVEELGLSKEQVAELREDFKQHAGEYFDLPVLSDYYLFCSLLNAIDNNNGKNIYWACYDREKSRMLTPAVWDLDCVVGGYFNPSEAVHPENKVGPEMISYASGKLLYALDYYNVEGFHDRLSARYKELRESLFSSEQLTRRFTDYMDMLEKSGAYRRDAERWSGDSDLGGNKLDYDAERAYICDWIKRRLEFLDRNLDYTAEQFYSKGLPVLEIENANPKADELSRPSTFYLTTIDSVIFFDKEEAENWMLTDAENPLPQLLGEKIGTVLGMEPQRQTQLCQVFLNGIYQGLRLLTGVSHTTEEFNDEVSAAVNSGDYEAVLDIRSFASWLLAHDIAATATADEALPYDTTPSPPDKLRLSSLGSMSSALQMDEDSFSAYHTSATAPFAALLASPNRRFAAEYKQCWREVEEETKAAVADFLTAISQQAEAINLARKLYNHYFGANLPELDEEAWAVSNFMERHLEWLASAIAEIDDAMGISLPSQPSPAASPSVPLFNLAGQRVPPTYPGLIITPAGKFLPNKK